MRTGVPTYTPIADAKRAVIFLSDEPPRTKNSTAATAIAATTPTTTPRVTLADNLATATSAGVGLRVEDAQQAQDAAGAEVLDVVVEPATVAGDVGEDPVERAEQRDAAVEGLLVLVEQRQHVVEVVEHRLDGLLVVRDQAAQLGGQHLRVQQQRVDRVPAVVELLQQQVAVAQELREVLVAVGQDAGDRLGRGQQLAELGVAGGDRLRQPRQAGDSRLHVLRGAAEILRQRAERLRQLVGVQRLDRLGQFGEGGVDVQRRRGAGDRD